MLNVGDATERRLPMWWSCEKLTHFLTQCTGITANNGEEFYKVTLQNAVERFGYERFRPLVVLLANLRATTTMVIATG